MYKKILTLILAATCTLNAFAGKPDSKALEQTLEKFRQAMIDGDSTALTVLTMPELSYGHSGGHVDDRKEFLDKLISGKSDFVDIGISGQTITITDNIAIVRHTLKAGTNDNGVSGTVSLQVMLVWKQQKSGWKLLARQAVKAK